MDKKEPLYSYFPGKGEAAEKSMRITKVLSLGMCIFAVLFWILGIAAEGFQGETALLFSIYPLGMIALFGGLYASVASMKNVYLLVCGDAIRYKKVFQKEEKVILLTPSEYQIKVKKYLTKGGYRVRLTFLDQNGKSVLRYSLSYSYAVKPSNVKRKLRRIGCEISGFSKTSDWMP